MADRKEYFKQYQLANKEKIKEYKKEYSKEYNKTENRKKSNRVNTWKQTGVISDNFDKLYNKYINTNNCDNCDVELIHGNFGNNKKVLDHDHETGQFRNILCCGCNLRRG